MKRLAIVLLLLVGGFGRTRGQTLTTIWSFDGDSDGVYPETPLVQGSDGYFYGTTSGGEGAGDAERTPTIFRIGPDGNLSNLCSVVGTHVGSFIGGGLVQGSDGDFYGTTYSGGTSTNCLGGCGCVFKVTPSGILTNLHSFTGPDGMQPWNFGGLIGGNDGNFYGTTSRGGAYGKGTVFRVSPTGNLTNLHCFNGLDGELPSAGITQGNDGNFYGTTAYGGETNVTGMGVTGYGTVFRMSASGAFTDLYFFSGPDGFGPNSALVQGTDGNFYGTTYYGGASNTGTVFRISPNGNFTNLYSFTGGADGRSPWGLIQGSDGNFYGTTPCGILPYCTKGTVFRISPNGTFTNLWSFTGDSNGANPQAGLVQGSDGYFYGTTSEFEGSLNYGTIFKISVPLNPPANQISSLLLDSSGTNLVFSIPSVAYETYQLQFSPSLNPTNWINVSGAFVSNSIGALLTLTNFGGAIGPQGFYRFAITP